LIESACVKQAFCPLVRVGWCHLQSL
jgi:hypothetical protein